MLDERKLGIWEKYLSVWVALCIITRILLGKIFPSSLEDDNTITFGEGGKSLGRPKLISI